MTNFFQHMLVVVPFIFLCFPPKQYLMHYFSGMDNPMHASLYLLNKKYLPIQITFPFKFKSEKEIQGPKDKLQKFPFCF